MEALANMSLKDRADRAVELHNEIINALQTDMPIGEERARIYITFLLEAFINLSKVTGKLLQDRQFAHELNEAFEHADDSTTH